MVATAFSCKWIITWAASLLDKALNEIVEKFYEAERTYEKPWPTKIHGHICHILKAKIKRPVFRKLSVMNLWISLHYGDTISKEKKIVEVLRIKNLKYEKIFNF